MLTVFAFVAVLFAFIAAHVLTRKLVEAENAPVAPVLPPTPTVPPTVPESEVPTLKWDNPKAAYHSVRVMCDEAGLSLADKNLLCSVIYQESQFDNRAIGDNGTSKDFGICQINDYWNIGAGKPFPSVDYVIAHPEECVAFLIKMFKAGKLYLWSSYKYGANTKWLSPTSPMWKLAQ